MNLQEFSQNLYQSPLSSAIREASGLIATLQSVHILAIAVLVGSVLVMDLRLAGLVSTDQPSRAIVRHHLPWAGTAVAVLAVTGLVQLIGEPNRVLINPLFWTKMGLLLAALGLTVLLCYPAMRAEDSAAKGPWALMVKPMAWLTILIWIAIIFLGRWIAYWI